MVETSDKDKETKLEVMRHFDKEALEFDFERTAAGYRLRYRLVKSLISREHKYDAVALDLGCGTGEYALMLAEAGFEVVGGDLSRGMLAVAKSKIQRHKLAQEIQLIRLESTKLPFQNETFDTITCIALMDWVPDCHRFLIEANRVIKQQASFIACVDALWSPYRIYRNIKFAISRPRKRLVRILNLVELKRTLTSCGFTIEKFFGDVMLAQVIAHSLYEARGKVLALKVLRATQLLDPYLTNMPLFKSLSEHYIIEARKK